MWSRRNSPKNKRRESADKFYKKYSKYLFDYRTREESRKVREERQARSFTFPAVSREGVSCDENGIVPVAEVELARDAFVTDWNSGNKTRWCRPSDWMSEEAARNYNDTVTMTKLMAQNLRRKRVVFVF